jgi:hypothetical protein
MTRGEQLENLNRELIEILKKGNLTIQEVNANNDVLLSHPDFDKIIDIISCIEELVE